MYGTAASFRPPADSIKPYSISIASAGHVEVQARGFWDLSTAESYWKSILPFLDESRCRLGKVKVLIDKRVSPVQSASVSECLHSGSEKYYAADDRIAMVLATNLQKLQARRMFPAERMKAFISYEAALIWLSAA